MTRAAVSSVSWSAALQSLKRGAQRPSYWLNPLPERRVVPVRGVVICPLSITEFVLEPTAFLDIRSHLRKMRELDYIQGFPPTFADMPQVGLAFQDVKW